MQNRKSHEEKISILLTDLSHQMEELEERIKKSCNDLTNEVEEQIRKLKDEKGKLYQEYEKLRSSGDKAFVDLKQGYETAFDSLSEALKKARAHFK